MELYNIIHDEKELKFFLSLLDKLDENEFFYMSLLTRKKYAPNLSDASDRTQLHRTLIRNKQDIIPKLRRLEIPTCLPHAYTLKDKIVPDESLVVYFNPVPRDMNKALKHLGKRCWSLMDTSSFNIVDEAMSAVQKSKIKDSSYNMTLDIDLKYPDIFYRQEAAKFLVGHVKHYRFEESIMIHTKGGFHIILKPHTGDVAPLLSTFKNNKTAREFFVLDNIGDMLSPLPGTYQGGTPVKFEMI